MLDLVTCDTQEDTEAKKSGSTFKINDMSTAIRELDKKILANEIKMLVASIGEVHSKARLTHKDADSIFNHTMTYGEIEVKAWLNKNAELLKNLL